MDDIARTAAEDCVKFVLARDAEAGFPAIFEARKAIAKVPAPGPLANVAGNCACITNLGSADGSRRVGEHFVAATNDRVLTHGRECREAADPHLSTLLRDLVERRYGLQVHQNIRLNQALLHHAKE